MSDPVKPISHGLAGRVPSGGVASRVRLWGVWLCVRSLRLTGSSHGQGQPEICEKVRRGLSTVI